MTTISVKYAPNPSAPQRASESDEEPNDVKGFVKFTIVKKRKGSLKVGDSFIADHKANGNINFRVVDTTEMNHWDNIFEGITEGPSI